MMKIGVLENESFMANMKLLRINRKIELYKENKKHNIVPNENDIEEQLDLEFSDIEDEYAEMQDDIYFDNEEDAEAKKTALENNGAKQIGYVGRNENANYSGYEGFFNEDDTRLDNQLYELLEKSYRELDLTMMSKLQIICEQRKNDSNFAIGDMKSLKKTKKVYENLIDENEEIILNIKCSDTYDKKRILENEKLLNKAKEDINKEIEKINEEYKKAEKELKKLMES